jgi:hypothetical protein
MAKKSFIKFPPGLPSASVPKRSPPTAATTTPATSPRLLPAATADDVLPTDPGHVGLQLPA